MIAPLDLERARQTIRRMRGVDARTDDGDATAIYLAAVIEVARPGLSMATIAGLCGYHAPDAIFFAELRELATSGGWMRREIVSAALVALRGRGGIPGRKAA